MGIRYGQKPGPGNILYIIDGRVSTAVGMKQINPAEIVKIEMLKDGKALSCNPKAPEVILVTTNRKKSQIVVRDREDRKPLASASLVFNEGYRQAGEDGSIDTKGMATGKHTVTISCIGYKEKTFTLDITPNSIHDIELERDYDTLQPVVVVGYPQIRCGRCWVGCGGWCIKKKRIDTLPAPSVYLKAFPNPAKSHSSIYLQLPSPNNNLLHAELLSPSGQLIKSISLQPGKTPNIRFDLPLLTAGMYYVRLTDMGLKKSYVANVVVE